MIIIARESLDRMIGSIADDEDLAREMRALDETDVEDVRIKANRNDDMVFLQVALEHMLKNPTNENLSRASGMGYGDELEEAYRELYRRLFGPLPEGPSPKVEYIRLWDHKKDRVFPISDWFAFREERYGPPPYDYDRIRAVAME